MHSQLVRTFGLSILTVMMAVAFAAAAEPVLIGKGVDAKWSPVREWLSFLRNDSLFVVASELDRTPRFVDVGPILHYEWLNDSCLLVQERFDVEKKGGRLITNKISTVCLDGAKSEVVADSGIVGKDDIRRLSVRRVAGGEVGYFDDDTGGEVFHPKSSPRSDFGEPGSRAYWVKTDGSNSPWGKVWLYYGIDGSKRLITTTENHYLLPRLAPTADKLFCSSARGDLVVFDTLGHELANLGRVDFPTWSSDGEWIAFCETSYTERDIAGSDVCLARFDGSQRRCLTNTADIIEVEPVFSPRCTKLIYRQEMSGNLMIIESGIE